MSIIPPIDPMPTPIPERDEIGREQKECRNCGNAIVHSRMYREVWVHPSLGYSKYCTDPLVGTPV